MRAEAAQTTASTNYGAVQFRPQLDDRFVVCPDDPFVLNVLASAEVQDFANFGVLYPEHAGV